MKKIMFNDRFGLTDDVLAGRKTMTRRLVKLPQGVTPDDIDHCFKNEKGEFMLSSKKLGHMKIRPQYEKGEEVAVSQSYKTIHKSFFLSEAQHGFDLRVAAANGIEDIHGLAGWENKMYVKADLMPFHIKISSVRVERLHDISLDDCREEGIIPVEWKQWLKPEEGYFGPQKYKLWNLWTLSKYEESIIDPWSADDPESWAAESAQVAFAVLIRKMMGRKVWESNPWVLVYKFKCVNKSV